MEWVEAPTVVEEDVFLTEAVAKPIIVVVAQPVPEEEGIDDYDSLSKTDACIICLMCCLCPCVLIVGPCSR